MVEVLENPNRFKKLLRVLKKKSTLSLLVVLLLTAGFFVTFNEFQKRQDTRQFAAPGDKLTVNTAQTIRPFTRLMLGQDLVNWEHSWGKPFPNEIPNLSLAMKEQGVGIIRYAGGLWANYVGFDRTVTQRTPYTDWTRNGRTYSFTYGTGELESLNTLADTVGSEVMIQVNVAQNDPSMWADMVRYTNIEKGYNFKYWELGNEFDIDAQLNITPQIYADRVKAYVDAMKEVDPTIQIISGVPGAGHDAPRQGYSDAVTDMSHYVTLSAIATSPQGRKPDGVSYHWYQACNNTNIQDLLRYSFPNTPTNSWRNIYSRIWSQIAPTRIKNEVIGSSNLKQGITELNFDACNYENTLNGNHLNAIWAADVIGRLAYNGLDFLTWYEGYANQGYSTIYANNADNPTQIFARPSYYTFYMYNKYFGDTLVSSQSFNETDISIWASTDSKDPGKLKLMVTNLTGNPISTPVETLGFSASSGAVYTLKSTNPTNTAAGSNTSSASTNINDVKFDLNNLAQTAGSIQPSSLIVSGSTFAYTFPPYTTTAIILTSGTSNSPTPTVTTTLTPTPTITPSLTPSPTHTPSPTLSPSPTPTLSPTPSFRVGDINKDNKVNVQDLSYMLSNWGTNNPLADLNNNGIVNTLDLSILLSNWKPN